MNNLPMFKCAAYGLCGYNLANVRPYSIKLVDKSTNPSKDVTLLNCPITSSVPNLHNNEWSAILTATISSVDIHEDYLGSFTQGQQIYIQVFSKEDTTTPMAEILVEDATELNNIQVGVSGLIEWKMSFTDESEQNGGGE